MWDLVPWTGMEPGPPTLGAQGLIHWTTTEVPQVLLNWSQSRPSKLKKNIYPCLNHLKEFRWTTWSRNWTITRDNDKSVCWYKKLGGAWEGLFVQNHCLHLAWQTFVYQTFALSTLLWIIFLPFEAPDRSSLLLSSGWHTAAFWEHLTSTWDFYTYKVKFVFLQLTHVMPI